MGRSCSISSGTTKYFVPPNPKNMQGLQAQVRHNAAEIQDYFSDLNKWEDEVKQKDKAIIMGDLNPVRGKKPPAVRQRGFAEMVPSGMPGPKDSEKKESRDVEGEEDSRIRPKNYQDYNQWDKFVHKDLDKILDDFDENERQEQEEGHRNRLAQERRKIEENERQARAHVEEAERLKGLGNNLLKTGDLEGARAMYGRAIETDPRNHIPFANRAQVLLQQGMFPEAIADCNSCLELDPRYVKALLRRASARASMGEKDKATADLKKVLMLEPANKQAKEDLESLTMTPEEERERQEREARDEKERRKRERGARKLMVREADDKSAPTDASDADSTRRSGIPAVGISASTSSTATAQLATDIPGPGPAPAKSFVSMANAREIARIAREAVEAKMSTETMQVPTNSIEFERMWKRVKANPEKYLDFLASVPPKRMPTYFKSDIDDDVLSAIVKCLDERMLPSRTEDAVVLLRGLQGIPRFGIAVKLMGRKDKEALERVLAVIDGADEGVCADYKTMLAK